MIAVVMFLVGVIVGYGVAWLAYDRGYRRGRAQALTKKQIDNLRKWEVDDGGA